MGSPRSNKEGITFWKSLALLAAMLTFCATTLKAQDKRVEPFLGIWNNAQTGQLIFNVPTMDGYTSYRVTIGADNKVSAENHPVVFDQKPYATTGGDARKISYKWIDANTVQRTQDRNGVLTIDTEQISKDGKTLTITGANGGTPRVFQKQFKVQRVK
jgi:hypothetical protein